MRREKDIMMKIQVFWDMMCCWARGSHCFAGISAFICKALESQKNTQHMVHRGHTEAQGTTFPQNVGNHSSHNTASYP
jgi:hypothetical protein